MKKFLLLLVLLFASGCATAPITQSVAFDENDFLPYAGHGTSKIIGQAFLKTKGGTVKYGAGNEVVLTPANPYTEERLRAIIDGKRMEKADDRYSKYERTTRADGQGNFEFSDIPAGKYIVGCSIHWEVGGKYSHTTGGFAYARATVRPGRAVKVMVTR